MRSLTVKREKSFVGCLVKMKVYIEDPDSNEILINNRPCRKIGELKNGEEKTFSIPEDEVNLYVIADKTSKDFCNELYKIPAGTEDLFLAGRNRFNPAAGNPFRFEGEAGPEQLHNRKKGGRIGLIILLIAIFIGFILGLAATSLPIFSAMNSKPKAFSSNGMRISLPDYFSETNYEGYTVCYNSRDSAVFALREGFDLAEGFGEYTLEQYGELILKNNNYNPAIKLEKTDGLSYFVHTRKIDQTEQTYIYYAFIYKSSDSFWLIQFATDENKAEDFRPRFIEWAKSVEFDKE